MALKNRCPACSTYIGSRLPAICPGCALGIGGMTNDTPKEHTYEPTAKRDYGFGTPGSLESLHLTLDDYAYRMKKLGY